MDKKIEFILIKYFSKSATLDDLTTLTKWLSHSNNKIVFKDYVKVNFLSDTILQDFDSDKEIKRLFEEVNQIKRTRNLTKIKSYLKYAAILVITIALVKIISLDTISNNKNTEHSLKSNNNLPTTPKGNQIVLTLEDGSNIALDKGDKVAIENRTTTEQGIVYNNTNTTNKSTIAYNYITIPKGTKYLVQLSDSTKIWMNSNSKLKYPVAFAKDKPREVELVYGEALFDVSKSENNNGNSFRVQIKNQTIEVLGTEFNIKAYNDESEIITTLVEGSVTVKSGENQVELSPSEQSIVNHLSNKIAVQKLDDVFSEIAWKDDYFVFKKKSMKDIMKSLSRWYDIEYIFKNPEKESKSFTGIVYRAANIDHILTQLQRTKEVKIKKENNIVIIE
ncbi:MAG: FecR family protein [Aestuariibaculum sp.]